MSYQRKQLVNDDSKEYRMVEAMHFKSYSVEDMLRELSYLPEWKALDIIQRYYGRRFISRGLY